MHSVHSIANDIVQREGGFVNDPDDPGGATNFGVTIHTMRRLGLDLNKDGRVDVADVKAISKAQAVEIFVKFYFQQPKIDRLPEPLWPTVFDMFVNSGSQAIRLLQRLFADMGYDIQVDGAIGPQTIRIAFQAMRDAPDHLVDAYGVERRNYYYRLADRRPKSRKYARRKDGGKGGWITRAEEFIDPTFRLSRAEHAERVREWS